MSHLHETVAENVSAAMVYPVLCFIPTSRVSLPASMDHHDDALASFEEEL